MTGTVALNLQGHLLLQVKDPPGSQELSFRLKEQEGLSLLKRCNNMEDLKQFHSHILKLGVFCDSYVAGSLVATCALSSWGSMEYASSVFNQIDEPCSFICNTMIKGHAKDLSFDQALLVYIGMIERDVVPDNFTYPIVLKACAWLVAIEEGMQIHGHVFKLGLEDDVYVQNSLISMYGKCGKSHFSCSVFEQLMDQKSVASWSAIISPHASLVVDCLRT